MIVREERKGKGLHFNETGLIDLIPCKDNEKSNISSDTNYSNSNTILSKISEM